MLTVRSVRTTERTTGIMGAAKVDQPHATRNFTSSVESAQTPPPWGVHVPHSMLSSTLLLTLKLSRRPTPRSAPDTRPLRLLLSIGAQPHKEEVRCGSRQARADAAWLPERSCCDRRHHHAAAQRTTRQHVCARRAVRRATRISTDKQPFKMPLARAAVGPAGERGCCMNKGDRSGFIKVQNSSRVARQDKQFTSHRSKKAPQRAAAQGSRGGEACSPRGPRGAP
jgi:hypothetical protein